MNPRRPSDSFLRSNKKRNALYASADGLCQECGHELEDGWTADHIVPYQVSGRTNVFEMQALCPSCNLRKGGRMDHQGATTAEYRNINFVRLRRGQRGAVDKLTRRVSSFVDGVEMTTYDDEDGTKYVDNYQHTAIVLPYGYGKSDVIRVSGALLSALDITGVNLILEPSSYLVRQITNAKVMQEKAAFYNLPRRAELLEPLHVKPPFKLQVLERPGYGFFGMTIQMASENISFIANWVESYRYRHKRPPLVFIDEVHSASVSNTWGRVTRELAKAGAALCLLTATPFRTDEEEIAGFRYGEESATRARVSRPRSAGGPVYVDLYENREVVLRLKPDYEYTLYEAWREDPPVICTADRLAFDLELRQRDFGGAEDDGATRLLSSLTPHEVEQYLSEILRKDETISAAVATLIPEFERMRGLLPTAKALVYSTNDPAYTAPESRNAHAIKIRDEIERQAQGRFRVKIATSTITEEDGEAEGIIQDFATPGGVDILIVKQMGGVGLDVPFLKTILDLSPTRTAVSWSQRIMRGDRVVEYTGLTIDKFDYITPDDVISRTLFEKLIKGEGGDTRRPAPPEEDGYIGDVRDRTGPQMSEEFWDVLGGAPTPQMMDTWGYVASGEKKVFTDEVYAQIRELFVWSRGTRPIIAKVGDIYHETYLHNGPLAPTEPEPTPELPLVVLGRAEYEESLRRQANSIMHRIVNKLVPSRNPKEWGEQERKLWPHITIKVCDLKWKSLPDRSAEELEKIVPALQAYADNINA